MNIIEKRIDDLIMYENNPKIHTDEQIDKIAKSILKSRMPTDTCIADISIRLRNRNTGFNNPINNDDRVASTLVSSGMVFRGCDGLNMSDDDCRNIQTFPQDYSFGNEDVKYICGMSVPPNMMANIATEIYKQWLITR